MVRAISVDSTIPSIYGGLVMALMNQAKYADARRWLDRMEQRFPGVHNAELAEIYLAAAQQDWDAAEAHASARIEHNAADSLDALDGFETLAGILMTRGRLAEAERDSRRVMALGERLKSAGRYYSSAHRLARLELHYRHAPAKAIAIVNAAVARFPLDSVEEGDRAFDLFARLYADAGQPARARQLVERASALETPLERQRGPDADRHQTLGVIALAEGRASEAEVELRRAADTHWCPICVLPDLARAYELGGKSDSAIGTYERYVNTPWQWRFEADNTELGLARKRLGELYEQRGDLVRARAQYAALLDLWRRADPELQPLLSEVRQRLARLGGG
jgi:tetratricopeptide (TPR) repeat protein